MRFEWDSAKSESNDMLPEHDFSDAEQGKYAKHFEHGVTAVLLDDDVAKVFLDAKQVNDILRALIPSVSKKSPRKRVAHGKA